MALDVKESKVVEETGLLEEELLQQKRAEEALLESEERYRSIVENSPAGIIILDDAYRHIYVNDELCRISGYSREEIIGQDFRRFLDDESKQFVADRYLRRQRGERVPPRYELNIIRKDGEKRCMEISSTVIKDSTGKAKTIAQILDITERKRVEEALRESQERFSGLYHSSKDAIGWANPDGTLLDVNDAFCRLTGYSKEELLVGKKYQDITPKEYHEWETKKVGRVLRTGEPAEYEKEYIRKDGSRVPILLTVFDVRGADDRPIGVAAIIKDITERKQAEEEAQRHLERLEALHEIDRAITSTLDLNERLDIILEQLQRVIPYTSAAIFLLTDDRAKVTAARGFPDIEQAMQVSFSVKDDVLAQQLLEGKRPLVLVDAQADERFQARGGTEYVRSWMGVPLIVRGEAIGFLTIDHKEPGVYDEKSAETALAFASQAAIAIENARLYEEAQARSTYLATLQQINATLRSTLPLSQVLETIVQGAGETLGYVGSLITLPDATGERLVFGAAWGGRFLDAAVRLTGFKVDSFSLSLKAEENPIVRAYLTGEFQALGRAPERIVVGIEPTVSPKLARVIERTMGAELAACVPLPVGDKVVGVLSVFSPREQLADDERAMLVGLADQAGLAIENARLYEERRRKAEELAVLNEIGRAVSSVMQLDDLLELIRQEVSRVIDTSNLYIALYEEKKNEVSFPLYFEEGQRRKPEKRPAKHGLTEYVIDSAKPLMINHDLVSRLKELDIELIGRPSKSWLGVPILSEDQVIGVLAIQDYQKENAYDESHLRLLSTIASQAAIAIENARLYEGERRKATQLAVINKVSRKAISILDLDEMLEEVARSICSGFNYYHVALFLVDKERHEAVMAAVAGGFEHIASREYRQSLDQGIIGWVIRTGRSWLANDVSQNPHYIKGFLEEVLTKSELCVPIQLGEEVIGALDIQSIDLNAFDETDVTAMETLCGQIAIAIQNARSYERLKEQNLHAISALAAAVEAKDSYTSGHSERVTQFAVAIAEKMGLSDDQIEDLQVAALLHDIGKIGIPDGVLNKPARLTSAEFLMIKAHSVIAAEIVGKIEALTHIVPIIRHHHERWDGTGYPGGLKGEEIPLGARILAVADGFEAMTSDRPYRKALTEEEVLAELEKGAGSQWDPKVVEVLVKRIVKKKGAKSQ